jgi:hypothetical protein
VFFFPEQPLKSSTNINATTAVTAAVAAPPIIRARRVEPLSTGFELKDFRFAICLTSAAHAAPMQMARRWPLPK